MTIHRVNACGAALAAAAVAGAAAAQTFDVERPRTIMVGTPAGGARQERNDAARTGMARTALPASGLRTEWRASLGTALDHAPLVDSHGNIYAIGTRGEVVMLGPDGGERWRISTSANDPGPAALLSDDTLVFVDEAGAAIAARDGAVRWRTRFGRSETAHAAPLPLQDGGVVVATAHDVAVLDADGRARSRITLSEATIAPLLSALGKVVAVTTSGAVWTWTPGAPEATRVASFGSPVDGGAALSDDHTLVAVTAGGAHLTAVDLARGTASVRAISPGGFWLGPPAMRGSTAFLMVLTPTTELAVAVNASGQEIARALVHAHAAAAGTDGGPTALVVDPHTAPLVDMAGTLAFATTDGDVGTVSNLAGAAPIPGAVELLSDACAPTISSLPHTEPRVVGLAPLSANEFVAACHSGTVLAVRGAAEPTR
jgi:hypothetical protein